jgi:hypothetical protein
MEHPSSPPPPPPGAALLQLLVGRWISQGISTAAELGLADVLAGGALAPDAIAARIDAHAPTLRRLLRALASVGIFVEDADGRFANTPLSEMLRSDVAGSLRGMAQHVGHPASVRAWTDLTASVRTGEPAFRRVHGKEFFEHLEEAPDHAAAFDHAMHGVSGTETAAVLDAYDFNGTRVLVDVGGGDGTLLRAILGRHPELRGVVYDLESVVARTRARLGAYPEGPRMQVVGGSFFESVPAAGDTFLLKHIIHDWNDERCLTILRNIRRVIPADGRLLIIDAVLQPGNDPHFGKILDLEMIALTEGGCERTEAEFAALLTASGFVLAKVVPTAAPTSIVDARPG